MNRYEIKAMYRNLNKNKKNYKEICNRIEELETKATKITPTYVKDETGPGGFGVSSKVENYAILISEQRERAERLRQRIELADSLLTHLKSHQRYLIKLCLIYHNSYEYVAKKENTSARNIYNIVCNAVIDLEEITESNVN